ncbi:site-specific integrase [Paraburkholderia sprentiae WSM5005]|uniref:Site-specific integrase n=1 Tax=Paraburkholderia sprentiae WSM5005 TaxID=754502 RepID=A0A1I9YDF8_9BURK|nr:site-specific integrase [Paraburkholderia sprentiae]APA84341.1 site-specific integrase [Paraburkholderia sprentiae WSM5005]
MTKQLQRINRETIRRLEAERIATIANGGAPKLRDIYDDQLRGFGLRMRPNGSVSFVYRWSSPTGQQKATLGRWPAMGVEEARAAVRAFVSRADHKADTIPTRVAKHERRTADTKLCAMPSVGQYLDGDYATYWRGTTKSETPEQNLKNIRRDFPDLLPKRLDEVTRPMMKKWIEQRVAAGCKPTGINRTLGAIGGLFSHAVEHEVIERNPCARLRCKVDPEEDEHGRELAVDEESRLRAALDARETRIRAGAAARHDGRRLAAVPGDHHVYADHVKPAVLLALATGMRRSEIMRLEWRSVDLKARTITVEPATSKVKRRRVIPLNAEAYAVLMAWRRQVKWARVFTNEIGEPLREVRDWNRIRREAKIEGFRFMDTRHDFATKLVNADASQFDVQRLLGHKDSRMSQRYMKTRETKLAEAVALLDRPRVSGTGDDSAQAA